MNLINHIGSISLKVEELGLNIEVKDIKMEVQDVSPEEYAQIAQAKTEQLKEVNESIANTAEGLKIFANLTAEAGPTPSSSAVDTIGSIFEDFFKKSNLNPQGNAPFGFQQKPPFPFGE